MQIYLDNNATTPMDPEVFRTMDSFTREHFGNPSSFHRMGQAARHAIEEAREIIASTLGTEPGDLIFTSGGTEADNLAIKGVMEECQATRKRLVVSAIEHQAVLHPAQILKSKGFDVRVIPVTAAGLVDLEQLRTNVDSTTALVSIMHANNELGTIQRIQEIARIAHDHGALFHTDAVQSFGKLELDCEEMAADLVSISAHKIYGPKGIGALCIRKGVKLKAQLHGGHQEKNIRPGTENAAAIVGFGAATKRCLLLGAEDATRIQSLRDRLEESLLKSIPGSRLNGDKRNRLYNTCNISFEGLDGETLLVNLDLKNIYASTGSACTAGSVEPSHVLLALGIGEKLARSAIRFSPGRFTTPAEIDTALKEIPAIIDKLRKAST